MEFNGGLRCNWTERRFQFTLIQFSSVQFSPVQSSSVQFCCCTHAFTGVTVSWRIGVHQAPRVSAEAEACQQDALHSPVYERLQLQFTTPEHTTTTSYNVTPRVLLLHLIPSNDFSRVWQNDRQNHSRCFQQRWRFMRRPRSVAYKLIHFSVLWADKG